MTKFNEVIENQKEFQRLVGFPIDSILEKDRNELSEKYIFKLIEEAVELRKEFPSVVNPWSKSQKVADLSRVKEEFSDVVLFLINILNVWKFTPEEILDTVLQTQLNNFLHIKTRKMALLNSDILKMPGKVSCIGQGNLTPKYVFVGLKPSHDIVHGDKVQMDRVDSGYFTRLIKCKTPEGTEPDSELQAFYFEFLIKELQILKANNPRMIVVPLDEQVSRLVKTEEQFNVLELNDFKEHAKETITHSN